MNSAKQYIAVAVIDFNKICRICMSEGDLVNIFSDCEREDCIFEMLACCTLTMVSEKDDLPNQICLQCLDELKLAYKFYQKSEVSDTRLHKLLEKSKQANQVKNLPSINSKIQLKRMQTALKHKLEISTIQNDESVSLDSDTVYKNIHNDHDYILSENICEKENSTPDESVLNSNETNTDTDIIANSSKTSNSSTYDCTKCSKAGFTYRGLRMHWMTVHGASYAERECEICNKYIGFKEFKQHVRSHPEYRPFACDLCDAKFKSKGNLLSHKFSHLKPHSCDKCDKRFSRLGSLQTHIENERCTRNLPAPEGYLCRVCKRHCPTKASLYQHSLCHGDRKYLCWYCGKGFTTRPGLQLHVRRHTGVKPYKCPYCPKSFYQSNGLKIHTFTHTGEKPFICEFCSKPFSQSQHLRNHIRLHTGEKPHKCSYCEKCYASRDRLRMHVRSHTGERPHVCDVCGKGFKDSSHKRRHMKIHARSQNN